MTSRRGATVNNATPIGHHLPGLLLAASAAVALALPSAGAPQVGETAPPAVVTPPPTQPPFRGVIAPTVDRATPAWNLLQRAPEGAPNILTVMRLIAAPGVAVMFLYFVRPWADWFAMVLFISAAVTDWFDGYLARIWKQESAFGAMLDPIADKAMVVIALLVIVAFSGAGRRDLGQPGGNHLRLFP